MNTQLFRDYITQSVVAVVASTLILGGSMATAMLMKARGFPDSSQIWHPFALFVREWGFLLILIPAAWVVASIWIENNSNMDFTKRWTFVTGLLLLVFLAFLMLAAVMLGFGVGNIIQVMPDSQSSAIPVAEAAQ